MSTIPTSCAGCKYLVQVCGHPWNAKGTFAHGRITDVKCYGCAVATEERLVFLMDKISVGCEMYTASKDDRNPE